jgi:hypothetical protein
MIKRQPKDWHDFLLKSTKRLLTQRPTMFSQMVLSSLPKTAGVYLITAKTTSRNNEIPYYIGRTKNIGKRLYKDHLMGKRANAALNKYLIKAGICSNENEAKNFIIKNCVARWIEEHDYKRRGAIEAYLTAILFPKYGIDKEH